MASPTVASSIARVSRESVRVERLRGSVQTVFPIHACMPQTANSETQDYGTVGSDGPIEGAAKVMLICAGGGLAAAGGSVSKSGGRILPSPFRGSVGACDEFARVTPRVVPLM